MTNNGGWRDGDGKPCGRASGKKRLLGGDVLLDIQILRVWYDIYPLDLGLRCCRSHLR